MKRVLITALAFAGVLPLAAQTDVSEYFLTNNGFDVNFNYDASVRGNIPGDIINDVYGWRNETTATYTVAGTFAYNPNVTFNNSSALPSAGFNGSQGGALGMSTGWGMKHLYSQQVTLPKGTYRLKAAYYNVGSATAGQSLLAWAPQVGSRMASKVKSFPVGEWIEDEVTIIVSSLKTGSIQIGFQTDASAGSNNHAKVLVDYVSLICDQMDKGGLQATVTEANTAYGDGSGIGAATLKAAIDTAQAVLDNADASVISILDAMRNLQNALTAYRYANASTENPLDMTSLITNPSFESGTNGWENIGFASQNNTSFIGKSGNYYLERWTSIGSKLPDVSVSQTIENLPEGRYIFRAATGHITQKASGSNQNNGTAQTGAKLFAGYSSAEAADHTKAQDLPFVSIGAPVTIGFKTVNATGNWVCFDNCQLLYTGAVADSDYASYLAGYVADIRATVLPLPASKSAREALESALNTASQAAQASNPVREELVAAKNAVESARNAFVASADIYKTLQDAIDYALKVRQWWESDTERVDPLVQAIADAQTVVQSENLTKSEAAAAVAALNAVVKTVDKQVYTADWSMGNINDKNNAWYIGRTRQTKNWILFWEKGYGDNPKTFSCGNYTLDIDEVLARADKAFEFYTDSLKYINRETSKTSKYKMVIRLRYEPTEWEASGSGVDNLIGLLTLTPWATPSRNWQTLYHEIGHCFQYQVHCDNNNSNGWMYAPGGGKGCAFWEQCAQWQAYKIMPNEQFTNEWFDGYMKNVHKHILHESPRYNNFFVQDYWSYLHGMDFMGRLWNQSRNPEDAVEAYIRINGITVSQFYDEMYDCAARFATWDIPHLAALGKSKINVRPQPQLNAIEDGAWRIDASVAPENTGHNIIRLNAPRTAKTIAVQFKGISGADGFRSKMPTAAEWRYGFVAYMNDGTRVYSPMAKSTYQNPEGFLEFECPANAARVFFVVSGGSSRYWRQVWDDNDNNDEQWPYEVKFGNTNKYGSADMPELTSVTDITGDIEVPEMWAENGTLHIGASSYDLSVAITGISGATVATAAPGTDIALQPGFYVATVFTDQGRVAAFRKIVVR